MANKHTTLGSLFKDIADAIRTKTGKTEEIIADAFADAILEIQGGADPEDMVVEANGSIGSQWVWDETEQGWCKDVSSTAKATLDGVTKTATTSTKLNGQDLYEHGVEVTKQGTATASDVLVNKTFTNSQGVGIVGTMSTHTRNDVSVVHRGGDLYVTVKLPSGYYPEITKDVGLTEIASSFSFSSNNSGYTDYYIGNNATARIKVDVPTLTLLWTNPNPSASFSAQTLSIPALVNYSYILIHFYYASTSTEVSRYFLVPIEVGKKTPLPTRNANAVGVANMRVVVFTTTTTLSIGANGRSDGASTSNAYNIPYKIYGLKNF